MRSSVDIRSGVDLCKDFLNCTVTTQEDIEFVLRKYVEGEIFESKQYKNYVAKSYFIRAILFLLFAGLALVFDKVSAEFPFVAEMFGTLTLFQFLFGLGFYWGEDIAKRNFLKKNKEILLERVQYLIKNPIEIKKDTAAYNFAPASASEIEEIDGKLKSLLSNDAVMLNRWESCMSSKNVLARRDIDFFSKFLQRARQVGFGSDKKSSRQVGFESDKKSTKNYHEIFLKEIGVDINIDVESEITNKNLNVNVNDSDGLIKEIQGGDLI